MFVGLPATVEHVKRAIERSLSSSLFDLPMGTESGRAALERLGVPTGGWAVLGGHTDLHVGTHDLLDDILYDGEVPVRLATEYPIRIGLRSRGSLSNDFDHEAVGRRVYAVMRGNAWPAIVTHNLTRVIDITRH